MNKITNKYISVIIGAGRIASGFYDPKSRQILTHAHAYIKNPQTELFGIYDINFNIAKEAAKKWNCKAYDNLDKMMQEARPDIVSICTPDKDHYKSLKYVAKYRPKIVICEKPLTQNLSDTKKIISLYKKHGISLMINYSRRFDEVIQKIQKDILKKKYGSIQSASAIYTKGILHNGSHIIDLAHFLFGGIKSIKALASIIDYSNKDKTVSAKMSFARCPQFFITGVNDNNYPIIEFDILFEKARFRYYDFGFNAQIQTISDDPIFKGFKSLSEPKQIKTQLLSALPNLIKNIVAFLDKKEDLICGAIDALQTQETCEKLLK